MALFGEDPLVQQLKNEVLFLREMLKQRDAQILALTNAHAYRLLNPAEEPPPPEQSEPGPYRPQHTMSEIMQTFNGAGSAGES